MLFLLCLPPARMRDIALAIELHIARITLDRPVRMTGDDVESGWLEGVEVGLGVLGPEVEMAEGAGDAGAEDAVLKQSAYRGARGRRNPRAVCRRPASS